MPGPQALGIRGSWHTFSSNPHLKPAVSLRKIKGSSSSSSFFASGKQKGEVCLAPLKYLRAPALLLSEASP